MKKLLFMSVFATATFFGVSEVSAQSANPQQVDPAKKEAQQVEPTKEVEKSETQHAAPVKPVEKVDIPQQQAAPVKSAEKVEESAKKPE